MEQNGKYFVNGRYMNGNEVVAYNLVSPQGNDVYVPREHVISLIKRGLVENMRLQFSEGKPIIRGHHVNLNNLPVVDVKDRIAKKEAPKVAPFKVVKRIICEGMTVGYVVLNERNKEVKLQDSKVIELAKQGLVENASVGKITFAQTNKTKFILRGIGFDIKSLPAIYMDAEGRTVDVTSRSNSTSWIVRGTKVMKPGILYNDVEHTQKTVKAGDILFCGPDGLIRVWENGKSKGSISRSNQTKVIGDDYLVNVEMFSFEALGTRKIQLKTENVTKWPIIEIKNT